MRSLWEFIIQSIFREPDSLQGNWLGRQVCDLDCEGCPWCDTFEE